MNYLIPFVITLLSGISTMIGSIFVFFNISDKFISKCLIFSSSIMLLISIFDLLPASFACLSKIYEFIPTIAIMAIYALFGGILVYVLDKKTKNIDNYYKIGIISLIALILHNLPEGIITFISSSKDIKIGIPLAISIAIHNIPEGISIAVPIYYYEKKKLKPIIYTLIASLTEPLGALIGLLFINNINNYLFAIILSITSGIMIYLSIFELFKEGIKRLNIKEIIISLILGSIILFINILL